MTVRISVTPQANALLTTLQARQGSLCLHMSGRYGTTLVCLPKGELRLGARDVLMGEFCSVPLYMMTSEAERWRSRAMTIGLARGYAPGFSLEAGSGYHFELQTTAC